MLACTAEASIVVLETLEGDTLDDILRGLYTCSEETELPAQAGRILRQFAKDASKVPEDAAQELEAGVEFEPPGRLWVCVDSTKGCLTLARLDRLPELEYSL